MGDTGVCCAVENCIPSAKDLCGYLEQSPRWRNRAQGSFR